MSRSAKVSNPEELRLSPMLQRLRYASRPDPKEFRSTTIRIDAVTVSHSASTVNPDGGRIGRDVPPREIERRLGDGYGGAADHARRAAAARQVRRGNSSFIGMTSSSAWSGRYVLCASSRSRRFCSPRTLAP